jgi:hypothetical protein
MRYLLIIVMALTPVFVFAAAGDQKSAVTAKFHTISSSTKRTCVRGEMRIDKSNLYVCYSSGAGKWKKVSLGNPF